MDIAWEVLAFEWVSKLEKSKADESDGRDDPSVIEA